MVDIKKTEEGNMICSFSGSLSSDICLNITDTLLVSMSDFKGKVIFDLKEVDYIASAFLRICQKIYKIAGKEHFSIINTSPTIKKVFKITGVEKIMDIQ